MSRPTHSYDSLVLLTRDVGEADRFCILFTRESGKRAARARGARKPGSRMGGLLLPMRHLQLELEERGEFATITSARDRDILVYPNSDVGTFSTLTQGVELLLRLTEDHEPLPGVFDVLLEFRDFCMPNRPSADAAIAERKVPWGTTSPLRESQLRMHGSSSSLLLAFQLRLLQHLGHLPVTAEDPRVARLPALSQSFLWSCARHRPLADLCAMPAERGELEKFRDQLLQEHLTRPLNAGLVAEAMK